MLPCFTLLKVGILQGKHEPSDMLKSTFELLKKKTFRNHLKLMKN